MAAQTGNQQVTLFVYPTYFMAILVFFSLAISFLTGVYPSGRASKIKPLDALRYE
jgi:ABC-type antimicrobial peptide transport system permease subunit